MTEDVMFLHAVYRRALIQLCRANNGVITVDPSPPELQGYSPMIVFHELEDGRVEFRIYDYGMTKQ